jgi:hypothetical protein
VQQRQAGDCDRVLTGDGQLAIAVLQQTAPQYARICSEAGTSEALLDATSQMLATLNIGSFCGSPIKRRACEESRSS